MPELPKRLIGIAADHGGYELKEYLLRTLSNAGYDLTDFGDRQLNSADDSPDFVAPLARAVAGGEQSGRSPGLPDT